MGVILGAVLVLAGAGVAMAAYLSSGTGSANAQSTVAVNSTIAPGSNGTLLFPGGSTDVTVAVSNPNPYPVRVLTISGGSSLANGAGSGCTAGTVTTTAVGNAPATAIAPGASGTYTLRASMAVDPANACQGLSFDLPLTATLASAAG